MEKKEIIARNNLIDFIKGVSCLFVVFIHFRFPGVFGECVVAIARTAVASFFVVSGYYLFFDSKEIRRKKVRGKIKRTINLIMKALVFYLIWESFIRYIGHGWNSTLDYIKSVFSIRSILDIVCFSYDPIVGHLWYLIAMVGAYVLFGLFFQLTYEPHWSFFFLLLEINIFCMALSNAYNWNVSLKFFRNAWFYAFPCMGFGYYLHKNEKVFKRKFSDYILYVGIIIGLLVTIVEKFTIGILQIYNGTLITVLAVFLIAIRYPDKFQNNFFTKIGSKYSREIYIFHWMVGSILDKILRIMQITVPWIDWLLPICVFGITLFGAVSFHKLFLMYKQNFKCEGYFDGTSVN